MANTEKAGGDNNVGRPAVDNNVAEVINSVQLLKDTVSRMDAVLQMLIEERKGGKDVTAAATSATNNNVTPGTTSANITSAGTTSANTSVLLQLQLITVVQFQFLLI